MGGNTRGAVKIAHEVICRFSEISMPNVSISNPARRKFLCALPAAAAAGFTVTRATMFSSPAVAQDMRASALTFKLFNAQEIQDDLSALASDPGNNNLVQEKSFTVVLTTEKAKSGTEFEWHEHRDHVFQILDGSTIYELGGTPKGAHSKAPGEWNSPESEGHQTVTLNKGDMLVIARGTPHRRITTSSVTFSLISSQGS
jgi:quercetin dioxygenase-like cupin family protein